MRIHHLSGGTPCPFGGGLISGRGSPFAEAGLVCHCLLIESHAGLVLVDTGPGTLDLEQPRRRLGREFLRFVPLPALPPRSDRREPALLDGCPLDDFSIEPFDGRNWEANVESIR
jgi:hypothetical protein